ncbi:MAG: glycerophosphodiester phosphodiesterase [Bdellovibrio sp.]
MIAAIVLLLISVLLWRHYTWKAQPWPQGALQPPAYQAHRGYWKEGAPENTLASMKAAWEQGFQMAELDVRLSADGIPVVFHDKTLRRWGDEKVLVSMLTARELSTRTQSPTLEQVLQSQERPAFINIELKTDQMWDGQLEKKVAAVVRQQGAEKQVLFSSFNPLALYRLSREIPQVPRALLATEEKDARNKIYLRHLWLAPYVNIQALHLDAQYVSPGELQKWKKRKIPVALWTVNDRQRAQDYLAQGALSIITDEPIIKK